MSHAFGDVNYPDEFGLSDQRGFSARSVSRWSAIRIAMGLREQIDRAIPSVALLKFDR